MSTVTRLLIVILPLLLITNPARADDGAWTTSEKIEGGYELGMMYGRPMHGGRLRLGIGSQNDAQAFWATVSGRYGATFTGLPTWDVRVGGDGEIFRKGIFHGGGGVDLGIHGFTMRGEKDISNFDDPAVEWALSLGLSGRAGIDVLKLGAPSTSRSALTLDGRIDGHVFLAGYYVSVGAFVGVRL